MKTRFWKLVTGKIAGMFEFLSCIHEGIICRPIMIALPSRHSCRVYGKLLKALRISVTAEKTNLHLLNVFQIFI